MTPDNEQKRASGVPTAPPRVEPAPTEARSSRAQELSAAALAVLLYLVVLDAAIETYLSGSPLRWIVAGVMAGYIVLSVMLWRRARWAAKAAVSLLVLLGVMAGTAWQPEGLSHGVMLLRQPTSTVLAGATVLVILLAGILPVSWRFVPLPGRVATGLLAAYGLAALGFGIVRGISYPDLFHGHSLWYGLPFWLQGAFVGALIIVPVTLLMHLGYGLLRIRAPRLRAWSVEALVLSLGVAIAAAGVMRPAGPARVGALSPPGHRSQGPEARGQLSTVPPASPDTSSNPRGEPWNEPPASQAGPKVPLRVGLTIVTAIATPDGDYESIKRITSVTNDAVSLTLSADVPDWVILPKDYYSAKRTKVTKHVVSKRTVRREDLRSSHKYAQIFDEKTPEIIPGSTAITTSAATLQELKQTGQTTITYEVPDLVGQSDSFSFLKRAEPRPVPLPVLLNNRRVELPALHATGDIKGQEFYFLDDPENPIVLAWNLGDTVGRLQVIKIALPSESLSALTGAGRDGNPLSSGGGAGGAAGSASPGGGLASGGGRGTGATGGASGTAPGTAGEFPEIKQSLEQSGRVEVYGIYFEFAQATIREESEPVLTEIAYVMTQNPSWKLSVEGHTDNIGTDAYNLDLSKRRAAAVKRALVERYHIAANRFTTTGFGASRPKESNATLAGRARNRRVEIVRQ